MNIVNFIYFIVKTIFTVKIIIFKIYFTKLKMYVGRLYRSAIYFAFFWYYILHIHYIEIPLLLF